MPTAIRLSPRRSFTEGAKSVWQKLKARVAAATRKVLNVVNPAGHTARVRADNHKRHLERKAASAASRKAASAALRKARNNRYAAFRREPFKIIANKTRLAGRSVAKFFTNPFKTSNFARI